MKIKNHQKIATQNMFAADFILKYDMDERFNSKYKFLNETVKVSGRLQILRFCTSNISFTYFPRV